MGLNIKKNFGAMIASPYLGFADALSQAGGGPDKPKQFPGFNPPKFDMKKTMDFAQKNPNIQIGGENGAGAINRAFSSMRNSAQNRSNAALTGNVDAIKRRFASQGGGGGGAEIAAISQAHDQAARLNEDNQANLDMQEQTAIQNRDLAQADMDFKQRVFNFDQASKLHQLDLAERDQQIQSAESAYNARVNQFINQPPKKGFISNLIDGAI